MGTCSSKQAAIATAPNVPKQPEDDASETIASHRASSDKLDAPSSEGHSIQSPHSDVVSEVKKDIAADTDDLMRRLVRMETEYDTPIEEVFEGAHDGKELGRGASGVVREVIHRSSGVHFAVKCLNKLRINTDTALQQLRDEITLMCQISHPNIVKIDEVFESSNQIFIVQELCTGGDLFDRLEDLTDYHYTEAQCAKLVKEMLSAICYLHKNGIVHRDLKLENFLFSSTDPRSELRMIDFGLSKHFEIGQHHHEQVGTPYTVAPEILSGDYTEKVDVWALGVITFLLLCGETPFGGLDPGDAMLDLRRNILRAELVFVPEDVWSSVSDAGKAFVKRLLDPNPDLRPTAKQTQHDPWIQIMAEKNVHEEKQLNPKTVEALIAFKESSDVQKLLSEVLSFSLLPDQIVGLRKEFEKMDTDGDGEISFMALKEMLMESVDAGTLEEIFDCIKIRKTALTLRWHEFLAAVLSQARVDDRNMRLAFDRLDSQRKGFLVLDDLLDVLGSSVDRNQLEQTWRLSLQDCQAHPDRITIFDFKNLIRGQAREALSPVSTKPVIKELAGVAVFAKALAQATRISSEDSNSFHRPALPIESKRKSVELIDEQSEKHQKLHKLLELRLAVLDASETFDKNGTDTASSQDRAGLVIRRKKDHVSDLTVSPRVRFDASAGTADRRAARKSRRKTMSDITGLFENGKKKP